MGAFPERKSKSWRWQSYIKQNGRFSRTKIQVVTMTVMCLCQPVPTSKCLAILGTHNFLHFVANQVNKSWVTVPIYLMYHFSLNNIYTLNSRFYGDGKKTQNAHTLNWNFSETMSYSLIHNVPQFSFRRLLNGGILIDNATLESIRIGLVPSHFLISVEYRKIGTVDVLIQVSMNLHFQT